MDSEKFEPINEPKAKSNKLFIIIAIAILLVIVLAVVVMAGSNSPRAIFEKQIDKILTYENAENYDTMKANIDLEMNVEGEDQSAKEIADLFNDSKISFNVEVDNHSQDQVYGIKLVNSGEELIDAKAKLEAESKKAYLDLGKFFNKTIEVDASEMLEEIADTDATETLTFGQMMSAKKVETILRKEVKKELKNEYFSSEKVTIEDENVTKNALKMSGKELKELMQNVCKNLADNDEFINCFKDGQEVKNSLKEMETELEDAEISDDMEFEIDIYTKGIFKNLERVDIVMTEDGEKVAIQITKKADEEYAYQLLENDEEIVKGTVKVHNTDNNLQVETTAEAEETVVTVKLSMNTVYNEDLTDINSDNSVKLEELTTEDMMALYGNFMGSELYKVIEDLSGSADQLSTTTDDDLDFPNTEKNSSSNKTNLPENIVMTYDDEKIEFSIPAGFEIYSSDSEYYKLFEKEVGDDTVDVDVSVSYSSLDEYIQEVKDTAAYYEKEDDYKNIKVSDMEEINIGGNKFYKMVISYEYEFWEGESEAYEDTYIAYEVDSDNVYTVEIENSNLIDSKDYEQFLNLKKVD